MIHKDQHESRNRNLQCAMETALEISKSYTEMVYPKGNTMSAVAAIIAAIHYPELIEMDTAYTRDELMEAVRIYAQAVKEFPMKFRYRNYNFFGKGHYQKMLPKKSKLPASSVASQVPETTMINSSELKEQTC